MNDFEWKLKNNPAPLNQQARNTVKSLAKLVTERLKSEQVCYKSQHFLRLKLLCPTQVVPCHVVLSQKSPKPSSCDETRARARSIS